MRNTWQWVPWVFLLPHIYPRQGATGASVGIANRLAKKEKKKFKEKPIYSAKEEGSLIIENILATSDLFQPNTNRKNCSTCSPLICLADTSGKLTWILPSYLAEAGIRAPISPFISAFHSQLDVVNRAERGVDLSTFSGRSRWEQSDLPSGVEWEGQNRTLILIFCWQKQVALHFSQQCSVNGVQQQTASKSPQKWENVMILCRDKKFTSRHPLLHPPTLPPMSSEPTGELNHLLHKAVKSPSEAEPQTILPSSLLSAGFRKEWVSASTKHLRQQSGQKQDYFILRLLPFLPLVRVGLIQQLNISLPLEAKNSMIQPSPPHSLMSVVLRERLSSHLSTSSWCESALHFCLWEAASRTGSWAQKSIQGVPVMDQW